MNTDHSVTVRFDVGGTVYRVSRSLLELFPDTMLSRMISEPWQVTDTYGDHQTEAPPIFIDRNGDRFQYVLDYMRDGEKVSLPLTVSKDGLLKDLEYYGFQNVNAQGISEPPFNAMRELVGQGLSQVEGEVSQVKTKLSRVEENSTSSVALKLDGLERKLRQVIEEELPKLERMVFTTRVRNGSMRSKPFEFFK